MATAGLRIAAVCAVVAFAVLVWQALDRSGGTGEKAEREPAATAPAATPPVEKVGPRLFAATSVWNRPLADDEQIDPATASVTKTFRDIVAANLKARTGPWIQTTDSSTPLYTVPADEPTTRVKLDAGAWATTLQAALERVPIPGTARPAAGPDAHMTIWQPSSDRLWELFHAHRGADGWHADYGGAMMDVSKSPGYYTRESWRGALPQWGASATSLPVIAGTMLIRELQAGTIPHALAVAVPAARAHEYAWPAQRTDGVDKDAAAVPEGARFRLDPALDIDSLHLPPVTRMIAKAIQRYGMVVRDQTAHAIAFYAQDPGPGATNPYKAIFDGRYPIDLLAKFPWEHLQLLKMQLSKG
jgi:hypothetical protein